MAFAAPWMLLGLAALAAPIIIHLLDRSKTAAQDWPSLRFLKIAHEHSAQRTKIKHLLVLLCRCLLLTLVVVAMAQPYRQRENWDKPPDLPSTLTIVLDASFSMGCQDASPSGANRFETAKRIAIEQVKALGIEDEAALVIAADPPVRLTDQPTRDLDAVCRLIDQTSLSPQSTDIAAALSEAFAVGRMDAPRPGSGAEPDADATALQKRRSAWRQVLLITDMQQGAWQTWLRTETAREAAKALPVTIVSVGASDTANRYIRDINVAAGGSGTLVLDVAAATSGVAAPSAKAALWIDGQAAGSPERVASRSSRIKLIAPMPAPGFHRAFVQLDADALPIDDRRYFCFTVPGTHSIAIVDGDPSTVDRMSETYYFRQALLSGDVDGRRLQVITLTPQQLSESGLVGINALVLANVASLDGGALMQVENFLRAGGNVLVALGDKVDIDHYNADWRFLPLPLDRMLGSADHQRNYGIVVEQQTHPIIAGDLDLAAARYFQFVGADPTKLARGGQIIASFTNGSPALVESRFAQRGLVLLLTGSIDADWSNLPYRRAYVPLADRIVRYLTNQQIEARQFDIGRPVTITGPGTIANPFINVTTPAGLAQRIRAERDPMTGEFSAVITGIDEAGFYDVDADERFGLDAALAVNVDTRESMLAPVDKTTLRESFGQLPMRMVDGKSGTLSDWRVSADKTWGRHRENASRWLLLAALGAFVMEAFVANWFTRRNAVKPRATTEYLGRGAVAASRRAG